MLRWHGIHTTTNNTEKILDLRDADELRKHTTEFLVIDQDADAPNLRFVLENSNDYVLLYRSEHSIWRRV